jgi:hypothetical protein
MYQYQELTPLFDPFMTPLPETFARKGDECLQLPDKAKVTREQPKQLAADQASVELEGVLGGVSA